MGRTSWLDEATDMPVIEERALGLEHFTEALADGRVDTEELAVQQQRLTQAMKAVEAELSDELHGKVTTLLVELTAYDIMRTFHELHAARTGAARL